MSLELEAECKVSSLKWRSCSVGAGEAPRQLEVVQLLKAQGLERVKIFNSNPVVFWNQGRSTSPMSSSLPSESLAEDLCLSKAPPTVNQQGRQKPSHELYCPTSFREPDRPHYLFQLQLRFLSRWLH